MMAYSEPENVPGDFEVVPSVEAMPGSPSNRSQKTIEAMDEKIDHNRSEAEHNEHHHDSSSRRHFDDDHPLPSSTVQSVAKVLLLAQLPFLMAGGVTKAVLQQRRQLMESCDADEAIAVASSQAENVLQRCRDDLKWIEMEMPSWMENKMAEKRRLTHGQRSRDARRSASDKSVNRAGKMTQGRCDSCDCSRSRSRRRGSILRKVLLPIMFMMTVHWILAIPLAIMRWTIGMRLPLWLVVGGAWMLLSRHRRHRRRGRGGDGDGSGHDSDSDVD